MINIFFKKPHFWSFIGAFFLATVGITTWATIPTLAYFLLVFGFIFGLVGVFLHRQNPLIEKEATITKPINDEFSVVKKELIDIFDDALTKLRSKGGEASGILSQAMERHRVAYEKFSRILERSSEGSEAVSGLDKVWNEYYSGDIPYAKYHTARFEGIDHKSKDQVARVEAIKRIKAIFKCIDEL